MPIANPLVQGSHPTPQAPAADNGGGGDQADSLFSASASAGPASLAASLGGGAFGHPDNTHVHVAILVSIALGVIVFLHIGGFRFAVDAGVTSR